MRDRSDHGSQKVLFKKLMANTLQGETQSQSTPKIKALYASESELKDQCVHFEEILDN